MKETKFARAKRLGKKRCRTQVAGVKSVAFIPMDAVEKLHSIDKEGELVNDRVHVNYDFAYHREK
jgi:hypothetical protein